jgi:hypothetical protein
MLNCKSGNTPRASLIRRVKSNLGVMVIRGHRRAVTSSVRDRRLYWQCDHGSLLWCACNNRKYFFFTNNEIFYFLFPFSDKSRDFLHINCEFSLWVIRYLYHFRDHSSENPALFYIFSPFVTTEQADIGCALEM